jgi:cysteinyl-tRNA synthetase
MLAPDVEPRATESIDGIIKMVEQLIANGHAYVGTNNDVYFRVSSYDTYGALSHKDLEQLQSGARVDVVEQKESPLDFVLWKKAKANEPSWASPWGEGRPGWHIECSVMSTHTLGKTFDIHGGGNDLLFPHHENERAQSECATHQHFVNYWLHTGFVQVDKEKMSKSLGNFFTIREILANYDYEIIRYFLLASHYRSPIQYSLDSLNQSKNTMDGLYTAIRDLKAPVAIKSDAALALKTQFFDAMNDDFNVPVALSVLFEAASRANSAKAADLATYQEMASLVKELGGILGILTRNPDVYFKGTVDNAAEIDALIEERLTARAAKNWARADEIRALLTAQKIVLEDNANGTSWRRE